MSRWDISDPNRIPNSELPGPAEQRPKEDENTAPAVGRSGTSDSSTEETDRMPWPERESAGAPADLRQQHSNRGRTYSLRDSELEAMGEIGRFRTVDIQDLARFVYRGDRARMEYDLENLRRQGLIEEKTLFRAHNSTRKMVTLTEQGYRMARKKSGLPEGQRIYHGFVKLREIEHDADIYKVYQRAVKDIREKGGKPLRVRLDFELKEAINRTKEAASKLPKEERATFLQAVASDNSLSVRDSKIHLPDIQVEYETREGSVQRENLELVSRNYREEGIRGKAAAGFKIYARTGEANRIRRALQDTGLIREVLSV
jgi:hypothetical protein